MPYVATTLIAHPECSCQEGHEVKRCPSTLLRRLLKEGHIKLIGEDGPPESLIVDMDQLSPLNQKQLIRVIVLNNLKGQIKPMTNWTDEQIRQSIRDVVGEDLNSLQLPEDANASEPLITSNVLS